MIRTRVGYSGGTTASPTYTSIGDHSETIQMDFDPTVVGYAALLDIFWESHNPENPPTCTQYKSAVFYHDDAQRQLAEQTKLAQEALWGTIHTDILQASQFYRAEDYHQKWYLRNNSILSRDCTTIYPDAMDFTDSTAVARINGIVARHYTADRLEAEIADFGLSEEANTLLRALAQN